MELLPTLILLFAFTLIVAAGLAILFLLLRRASVAQFDGHDRQATTLAVVDSAMVRLGEIAEAKLDARMREGNEKLEKNLALGHARYDAGACLLYTSPSPRDQRGSRMPSSA